MQVDPRLLKRFEEVYGAFAEEEGLPSSISFFVLRCDDQRTDVHLAVPYSLAEAQRFQQYVDDLQAHQLQIVNVSASKVWFPPEPKYYGPWVCLMVRGRDRP